MNRDTRRVIAWAILVVALVIVAHKVLVPFHLLQRRFK